MWYWNEAYVCMKCRHHLRYAGDLISVTARRAEPWPDLIYAKSFCKVCTGESRNYEP